MIVDRNLIESYGGTKNCYRTLLETLGRVPLEYNAIIYHVIGSYFGRKYLNLKSEKLGSIDIPTVEYLTKKYGAYLGFINESYILNLSKCYLYIQRYAEYYKTITYHEYVPDCASNRPEGISEQEYMDYCRSNLKMVMGIEEYQTIKKSGSLYFRLSRDFAFGIKYVKDKFDTGLRDIVPE